jgi:hypothetical protein
LRRRTARIGGLLCVPTAPCPRCTSLNTEVIADAQTMVLILRHCLDCRYAWDFDHELSDDEEGCGIPSTQ